MRVSALYGFGRSQIDCNDTAVEGSGGALDNARRLGHSRVPQRCGLAHDDRLVSVQMSDSSMMQPASPPMPRDPPLPDSPPSPPTPPPIVMEVAKGVTLAAVCCVALVLAIAARLMMKDKSCSRLSLDLRLAIVGALRLFAILAAVMVAAAYYAESRFSVVGSSSAAAADNPLMQLWRRWDTEAPCGGCHHFGLWIFASSLFVLAGVALAVAELLNRGERFDSSRTATNARAPRESTKLTRLRWHIRNSKLQLGLILAFVGTLAILVGRTIDRAIAYEWGRGWDPQRHRDRVFLQIMLEDSAFYAGVAGLLPMTLLGIPLGRTSALWRAVGRSYEEAISFHRALGHLMMALYTYHALGYIVYWWTRGVDVLIEEITDWLDCGKCTHINNLAGLISWAAGFVLWLTSLECFRRRRYHLFFSTHQLHLVFFAFGCIHWPTCLAYAAPSIIFYTADLALRAYTARASVLTLARVRPSLTTLVIANPLESFGGTEGSAVSPTASMCPHGARIAASGNGCSGTSARVLASGEDGPNGEDDSQWLASQWSGGSVYLAVPSLGRLPYLQWHPFSIAGANESGALIVHVTKCKRWTQGLARIADSQPRAEPRGEAEGDGPCDGGSNSRDRLLRLHVIGPIPPPPALLACVSKARTGVPLLLIGGGSGHLATASNLGSTGGCRFATRSNIAKHCSLAHQRSMACADHALAALVRFDRCRAPRGDSQATRLQPFSTARCLRLTDPHHPGSQRSRAASGRPAAAPRCGHWGNQLSLAPLRSIPDHQGYRPL